MEIQEKVLDVFEQGRWSIEEQECFILGIMLYGKDWKKVQQIVKTRNGSQVRSHAQKFFQKVIKSVKDKKKLIKRGKPYANSQDIEQFLKLFPKDSITQKTPIQIISLLKIFQKLQFNSPQLIHHKLQSTQSKIFQNKSQSIKVNQPQLEINNKIQMKNQFYSEPQSSYFMFLLRNNIDHLSTNCYFPEFIDFGRSTQINQPKQPRKRSFQIPNEQYDEQKLKKTLQNIRKDMNI